MSPIISSRVIRESEWVWLSSEIGCGKTENLMRQVWFFCRVVETERREDEVRKTIGALARKNGDSEFLLLCVKCQWGT